MRSIIRQATAMALVINAGAFLPPQSWGPGPAALQLAAAKPPPPAIPVPPPQNANDVVALFDGVLAQTCQAAYTRGQQLGTGWQQQVAAEGQAKYAGDLLAFRDASAMCLAQIGTVITTTDRAYSEITSAVVGTWNFAPDLWIATNSFAAAVADDATLTLPQRIAKATPLAQRFSASLDQFAQWIAATGNRLAQIQSQQNAPPTP
ncbi:MAG TPA: hypothetical protein VGL83_07005 [Stellaceae bacterium]|jgi:hypothetical protein